jgi:hypothetical protein
MNWVINNKHAMPIWLTLYQPWSKTVRPPIVEPEPDGETLELVLLDGETLELGDTDGLTLLLGDTDELGETDDDSAAAGRSDTA